jgi:DNA polymerase-3 subunit delta'
VEKLDPCDTCLSCRKIENGLHPDVSVTSAGEKGAIKIEQVRELKRLVFLRPYEGRNKIFIINDAHQLTAEAQSALLKLLEEPPESSYFILVSAKPGLLFRTIISRCQCLKFRPLKRTELEALLRKEYSLGLEFAHYLAYFSEGRLGQALRLKQEPDLIGFKNRVIDSFTGARRGLDFQDRAWEDKEQFRRSLNILAGWLRDIYLVKANASSTELINLDRRQELLKASSRYSHSELERALAGISNSLLWLENNINLRLLALNLKAELWKK